MKDHRSKIHPAENITSRKLDPPICLRTQYQVENETQIMRNQKVNEKDNVELVVKNNPKSKPTIKPQPKFKPPNCISCKKIFG